MEHLNLPKLNDKFKTECFDNAYDPIPFQADEASVGNRIDESKKPFQAFPDSVGYEVDEFEGKITKKLNFDKERLPFGEFLQSWLFYGLITAVVYDNNSDKDRQFQVSQFRSNRFKLSTEHLNDILMAWQTWELKRKVEKDTKQKLRMMHAQLALDLARKVVMFHCSAHSNTPSDSAGDYDMEVSKELALSLMVIGETLSNAKARILKRIGLNIHGWSGDPKTGWGIPRVVLAKMSSEGWCPRTIELLKAQLPDQATALLSAYALHSDEHFQCDEHLKDQHESGCTHKDCTHKKCVFKSERPQGRGEYATKHHPDCLHFKKRGNVTCWSSSNVTGAGDNLQITCSRVGDNSAFQAQEKMYASQRGKDTAPITCITPCSDMLGPPMDEVVDIILRDKKIPLLRFKENTEDYLELEVTDSTQETEYATISHVWSDGYGNPHSNKLYRCQLDYLYRLLKEAQSHRLRNRRGATRQTIAFWMDTLIVPVENQYKEARKFAIYQIYDVFDKAKYTIVIDNGLNRMEWDHEDYTSTAMKILASGWMRRLWTLQEAFVSRKLMFAFKGSESGKHAKLPLIDLDDIEDLYDDSDDGLSSNLQTIARTYYKNMLGPNRRERLHKNVTSHGMSLIADVWRAAQWRTMEHEENETLALATLLNLDMKRGKTLASPDLYTGDKNDKPKRLDEKMKDFWLLLEKSSPGAIPPGIIFLAGERNSLPGFGWAPRSWMSALGEDYPDPIATATHPARLLADEGLEVHYPGFLLHYENEEAILSTTSGDGFWFPCDSSMTEIYHVTRPDLKEPNPRRGAQPDNRDLAIILCRPRPGQVPEIALLVRVDEMKEERLLGQDSVSRVIAADILYRVKIEREVADEKLKIQKEKFFMKHKREHKSTIVCGEALSMNQKWYVDCRTFKEEAADTTAAEDAQSQTNEPASSPMKDWGSDHEESLRHIQGLAKPITEAPTDGLGLANSIQAEISRVDGFKRSKTGLSHNEDHEKQSLQRTLTDTHKNRLKVTQKDGPGNNGGSGFLGFDWLKRSKPGPEI